MKSQKALIAMAAASTIIATHAQAAITITQQATPTPTYSNLITFDEPGVPVGVNADPFIHYQSSLGISFTSGNGGMSVNDFDTLLGIDGGQGDGNQLNGGFGITMWLDSAATSASWQGWADGSRNPPFGGIVVFVYNNGVEVGNYSGVSPYGGIGDEWFNVVATDGDQFDQIVFFNGAFNSFNSYVDNVSWNAVPAPGALALFGAAGLVGARRKRRHHN